MVHTGTVMVVLSTRSLAANLPLGGSDAGQSVSTRALGMVGAMEFGDVVRKRRMVRNYTSEPVDRAVLERIAPSMLRIPSAGFTQGVAVVVVTDQSDERGSPISPGRSTTSPRGWSPGFRRPRRT